MKIFLLGLPGSGKTTLAKGLADDLQLPFVDLDAEIERLEGHSVQKVFETKKEEYFREVESRALQQLCESTKDFVMAVGGGSPCFYDNMSRMNATGISIFLDVPEQAIVARLTKTNLRERPLLANLSEEGVFEKIKKLRDERIAFYSRAQHTLRGDVIAVTDLTAIIKSYQP